MAFRLFQYRVPLDGDLQDLNAFIKAQDVLSIQRELVSSPAGVLLIFIVEYQQSENAGKKDLSHNRGSRVDYQALLTPLEYDLFGQLRDVRKLLADEENQPVYSIVTNAQLAAMVQNKCSNITQMQQIAGIGEARAAKYGPRLLMVLKTAFPPETV